MKFLGDLDFEGAKMMKKKETKTKSSLSAFRDSNSSLSSSSSSSSSSDECSSGSSRSARTEGKKLVERVKNKQKLDCKKPGASEQQLIETVGGMSFNGRTQDILSSVPFVLPHSFPEDLELWCLFS